MLTSRDGGMERTIVRVPRNGPAFGPTPMPPVEVGGRAFVLAAGPCAVEGREMVLGVARAVRSAGAVMLRGGAFKPRTSPYAFQGLGPQALELLDEARALTGLAIITEVLDPRQVELVARHADVLQIGARNMQNYALLAEVGRAKRPVLLKRGFAATIEELLMAAEHVMSNGNGDVILCERGIRTFETKTRNTLDVAAVPVLKRETHLPVFVDPSHAAGRAHYVLPLALAAVAAGADGLIVEVHPHPASARSDGDQSVTPRAFGAIVRRVAVVATAVGRELDVGKGVIDLPPDESDTDPTDAVDAEAHALPAAAAPAEAPSPFEALARIRADIETVDREIISLLSRRVALARRAGRAKRAAGVGIIDPIQEAAVLERARELAEAAGLPYRDLRVLLRGMIAVSRRAQLNDAETDQTQTLDGRNAAGDD